MVKKLNDEETSRLFNAMEILISTVKSIYPKSKDAPEQVKILMKGAQWTCEYFSAPSKNPK